MSPIVNNNKMITAYTEQRKTEKFVCKFYEQTILDNYNLN